MQGNPIFMEKAIALATENVVSGRGGPFGAVIVKSGEIVASGTNLVTATTDPTAHAEVVALRNAATALSTFDLSGCEVYTSCEPCPMCLAAIYWSHCDAIFYGNTSADAAAAGFDDAFLYEEIKRPANQRSIPSANLLRQEAISNFEAWRMYAGRIDY
ncbi:MAG: tRNA-specific adenosine deaminase [Acidobacteriales bacterium 59-55]|nr:nucleoside deaminase [Terriglobales bacterium]OJV40097.1 MAG: tRNA-specific adenosine deaminase [Acidobacteriales bacterium 59-55]